MEQQRAQRQQTQPQTAAAATGLPRPNRKPYKARPSLPLKKANMMAQVIMQKIQTSTSGQVTGG